MQYTKGSAAGRPDYQEIKRRRVQIFRQNIEIFSRGYYEDKSTGRYTFQHTDSLMGDSEMYTEPFELEPCPPVEGGCRIEVVNEDCIEVAGKMVREGYDVAILNMASRSHPGGGVDGGAGAQEEQLCRRSNLILSLYRFSPEKVRQYPGLSLEPAEERYPMHPEWGGIHSPDVTFFREGEGKGYALMDVPFMAGVISVAALNRPVLTPEGTLTDKDARTTGRKVRTILRIALENGYDAIVLGALGCGAFGNPPSHVAKIFHQALLEEEFRDQFRRVTFAILEDYNSLRNPEGGNLAPFRKEFSRK